ncbi:unnamed protein product, partial [Rotaria sp. Silwood2]
SRDVRAVHPTNSSSNKENSPSKSCLLDVRLTNQDSPSQPYFTDYPKDTDNRVFQMKWYTNGS